MTHIRKFAYLAGAAAAAFALSAPAVHAQANGIAVTEPAGVIASSKARIAAWQQIEQTYSTQMQQIQQASAAWQAKMKPYDTNNDNQLGDNELAAAVQANPNLQTEYQQHQQTLNGLQAPIISARLYALEQIVSKYNEVLKNYATSQNISFVMAPSMLYFYPQSANISKNLVTNMDAALPSVAITPPADFRPKRDTVSLLEDIQEMDLIAAYRMQLQQQQQAGQTQQPSGR